MTIISVKGGISQEILDGSQDTLSLLAITTGTGLVHVGDPSPDGFDVPFRGGDQIVLPANLSATLRADGFIVTGSIGQYGSQIYSGGGTPDLFWEPFTVTAGDVGDGGVGYSNLEGEPTIGSITNEPLAGYILRQCFVVDGNWVLKIAGPLPLLANLYGGKVGINLVDYDIPPDYLNAGYSTDGGGGFWVTDAAIEEVPVWTVGQQVPIVIIP